MQLFPLIEDVVDNNGSGRLGAGSDARPEALRFATVKLSLRGNQENRKQVHRPRPYYYLPILTYDIDPEREGSAPVITMATRVTMFTMIARNL